MSEEVYRTYCRTGWNIKDNDQSFFDHEIQLSGIIGSQDGAYENFREFVDSVDTPENIVLSQIEKEALYQAISALPTKSRSLVQGLFFDGLSEYEYADSPTVIAAPVTSKMGKARLPTHVSLNKHSSGLHCGSTILLEQLRTIDKSRLKGRIGMLSEPEMKRIDWALGISIGLAEGYD